MPSDGEALKQMAKGLFYIHRQQFVNRDIKPSNILISKNEPVQLMLANFSLCKAITDLDTYSIESGNNGDEQWMAPEILECFDEDVDDDEPAKLFTISSDTWALGCAFFYFLTRGIDPFGTNFKKIRYNMFVKQRPSVEFESKFKIQYI
jgi:serine/threonine-protein kinase/endoribonuclease IRE1